MPGGQGRGLVQRRLPGKPGHKPSMRLQLPSHGSLMVGSGSQVAAMRHAAIRLTAQAAEALHQASGGRDIPTEGPVWNGNTVALIRAAKAHGHLALVENFVRVLRSGPEGLGCPKAAAALGRLSTLFALLAVEQHEAVLLEGGYLSPEQSAMLRRAIQAEMARIRPDAVALVDSFGFDDYYLNRWGAGAIAPLGSGREWGQAPMARPLLPHCSALGRSDGNVYQALYEMAQGSPLNRTEEGPAWDAVIKPGMSKPRARL